MKIDASGRICLPDPQFANGQILNVKEHVNSASAHNSCFIIIDSPGEQVKESDGVAVAQFPGLPRKSSNG
jgi:hypothetical protein